MVIQLTVLVTEAKISDDLAIAFDIGPLEIVQQAAAASYHLEEALTRVVIFCMGAEVVGQIVDVICEDCDLDDCGAGVRSMRAVLFDCRCFLKCHVVLSSPRGVSALVVKNWCKPLRIEGLECKVQWAGDVTPTPIAAT